MPVALQMGETMKRQEIPIDLTTEQQEALNGYFNNPKKLFYGIGLSSSIAEFREINNLRSSEPAKAELQEERLLKILRGSRA